MDQDAVHEGAGQAVCNESQGRRNVNLLRRRRYIMSTKIVLHNLKYFMTIIGLISLNYFKKLEYSPMEI